MGSMDWLRSRWLRLLAVMFAVTLTSSHAFAQARPRPPPGPRPAPAQEAAPVAGKVDIGVMVVHATNAHNRVDPKLEPVMQHLRFLNFKGFTLLSEKNASVSDGQEHTFTIAGNRQVRVTLLEHDAKQAKIRVQMFDPNGSKKLDTTVSVFRNKSFMVAGPKHDDGVLVLPLTPRY